MKKENRDIADIIKYDGIKSKGFGTIPKFIMHDRDLTIESKAIYGYFCSLCGSGTETFPLRSTILSTLKLSKNGYYGHYKALIEQGYISVSKANPADIKSGNIYTIISNPKKLCEKENEDIKSKLITEGIDSYGYGILPKAVMIDERLDIKAKGLYCYLASYAGAGKSVFPEKKNILYHLQISETIYYKYYNELIMYNYITPLQRRVKGQYSICDYILNQKPDEQIGAIMQEERHMKKAPNIKNEDIVKPRINSEILIKDKKEINTANIRTPNIKKGDTTKGDIKKGNIKKRDTIYRTNVSNNKSSINSNINQSIKNERMIEIQNEKENFKDEKEIRQIIKDNDGIPYAFLSDKSLLENTVHTLTNWNEYNQNNNKNFDNLDLDKELFSLANKCLIDMLSCKNGTYKGSQVSNNYIRERINEIIEIIDDDFSADISLSTFLNSFLDDYKRIAGYHEIKFPIQHMKTCLFSFFTEFKFKHSVMLNDASRVAFGGNSIYQKKFLFNNA